MKEKILFVTLIVTTTMTGKATAEQLIVNSYGGPYEDIIRSRIIEPFEKEFNVKVIYDAVGSASQDYAKIKATRGRPGFDVVVMTASQSLDGCRDNLLEKFSPETVPNIAELNPDISGIAGACGAVHEVQYLSLLWRKDKLATAPVSWSALFDEELKGKVILPTFQNIMAAYLMQIMSVTNGGDLMGNVDPGFEAMGRLAQQSMGFEQSSSIMENYLKEGEVWAMPFWNGRAQLLVDSGLPVDYVRPKEGTIPLVATLNVPIGARNKDMAYRFVNFFLEKSSQEAWVTGYNVGSARTDIEVPDAVRARQITTEADLKTLLLPDLSGLAAKLPEWGARWEREVIAVAR
ncbi:ABC transporter substrate-binding protein [Rhizobium pusense]|uniref:ABC transporter substrate-binding protein n=1 Tax=Agrobacterium pusense TaxID=648995 RepID=UPI000D1A3907|nr:ABC transporter substrate-binding protein [Agrobacterium pusense]MDH0910497.1 ABC transporter substrate-binding protein [Agrobacterium pusense]MDH1098336.1 ABC transporter substrate-binding protein [Agrobacterium pusense]MDH1114498.1 ABC transporter substrate-binding protein [Agrobacterium pusense]MDH2195738.1 ABC transporter substrate-binding protein [Agrobacterium pusense]